MQQSDLPAACNQDSHRIYRRRKRSRLGESFDPEQLSACRSFQAGATVLQAAGWAPALGMMDQQSQLLLNSAMRARYT
jgi:hypothetical protein